MVNSIASRLPYNTRTVSVKKLVNASKVFSSYHYSRWRGEPLMHGLPVSIAIEPTTSCNLRCPECPSGLRSFTRPTGMLNERFFRRMIDEASSHVMYLTFYFQGEPYLNPKFLDMVTYAAGRNIFTVTSTNAHYLTEENARRTVESGLDRLIISIDGATQEVYEKYRMGGQLEKVMQGTANLLKMRRQLKSSTPEVVFQFLVVKPNQHQVGEVKQIGSKLGVDDVWLKTAQVYHFENGHELIPTIGKFSRYKKVNAHFEIKNRMLNHCWKMWHSCVITWDGKVVPCCFDKDARHVLGDLAQQSLSAVWYGERYSAFRGSLLKSRKEIDICTNCSEGTRMWM
jgi:radical SAM protein with 4Fe4S-binding SPASM domain